MSGYKKVSICIYCTVKDHERFKRLGYGSVSLGARNALQAAVKAIAAGLYPAPPALSERGKEGLKYQSYQSKGQAKTELYTWAKEIRKALATQQGQEPDLRGRPSNAEMARAKWCKEVYEIDCELAGEALPLPGEQGWRLPADAPMV